MSGRVSKEDIFIFVFPVSFANASSVLSDPTLNGTLPSYEFNTGPSDSPSGKAGFVADTTLLRARVLGNTLAAIAYGFSILLFLTCLKHLRRKKTYFHGQRQKWGLYVYITAVIILGSAAFLQNTIYATVTSSFVRPERINSLMDTLSAFGAPLPSLFIIWAADGLMFYRTVVLYHGIPTVKRFVLLSIPGSLFMASVGGGAFLLITAGRLSFENSLVVELLFVGRGDPGVSSFVMVGVCVVGATFGSNIVLCLLIVVRLHHHQKRIESVLGKKRGSPYRRIMVMCVESCAFIVAIVFLGGILWGAAGLTYSIISLMLLPQACSISAIMLVSRVARGRAVDTSVIQSESSVKRFDQLEAGNRDPEAKFPINFAPGKRNTAMSGYTNASATSDASVLTGPSVYNTSRTSLHTSASVHTVALSANTTISTEREPRETLQQAKSEWMDD
ncbi:hypothetical protein HYPSUDRAFT_1014773 [Hypholoma sublateritium FD-334 SS-4]|uniref:Uncharacterized protein n=1 Tax=Hypholoma sublateritium (strain FD-334 SS-4) TaxID=945553 RepID=A0A0D2NER7_HYPSF|nr:hypothetical protein HYPSUDRAFT_1014773 [Hypholoma sublateritium FD-334 SS-4]